MSEKEIIALRKKIKSLKLENLVEEKKSILFESQLARLSRTTASIFILGFFISLIIFIVMWYFSVDQGSLNGFFNNVFCNKKS